MLHVILSNPFRCRSSFFQKWIKTDSKAIFSIRLQYSCFREQNDIEDEFHEADFFVALHKTILS